MRHFPSRWTINLNREQKENFQRLLLSGNPVIVRLLEILREEYQSTYSEVLTDSHFNKPDWATRHAYLIGQLKQIQGILDLFEFPEVPDHGTKKDF